MGELFSVDGLSDEYAFNGFINARVFSAVFQGSCL